MSKTSPLYQHARAEFVRRGLLAKGEPLPNSLVGIILTIVDAYDDYASRHRSVGGVVDLVRELVTRLPVRQTCKDMDGLAIENMARLMCFLPLTPLTGADDEWAYQSPGVDRNKRCPRVQRDAENVAYDTKAPQPDGSTLRKVITFPYFPERKA